MNTPVNNQVIKVRTAAETVAPFQVALQRTILRVELGLSAQLPTSETALPNTILKVAPAKNFKLSIQERHEDFGYWLIATGLREFSEAFHLFLDDIHITCRWYDLATVSPVTDEHIQKLVAQPHAEFHSLDFPKKLKTLRRMFGIQFSEIELERVRTLNKVRNCYAHRRGIVRAEDTNGNGTLLVKWLGLRYEIDGNHYTIAEIDEQQSLKFKPGKTKNVILCTVERRFKTGDQLTFSTQEFAEFGITYMLLADRIIPQLELLAKKCFPNDGNGAS